MAMGSLLNLKVLPLLTILLQTRNCYESVFEDRYYEHMPN
jgi:hypothetical protein